jgi:hypothetical protein
VLVIGPSLRPITADSILSASVPNKAAPSSLGTQRYSDAASISAAVSREDYGLAELLAGLNPVPEGGLWDTDVWLSRAAVRLGRTPRALAEQLPQSVVWKSGGAPGGCRQQRRRLAVVWSAVAVVFFESLIAAMSHGSSHRLRMSVTSPSSHLLVDHRPVE